MYHVRCSRQACRRGPRGSRRFPSWPRVAPTRDTRRLHRCRRDAPLTRSTSRHRRHRDAVRRSRTRPRRERGRRGRRHDVCDRRHWDGKPSFGDGGTKQQSGVMNKLMGAGKRLTDRREPLHDRPSAITALASSRWRSPRPTRARSSRWISRSCRASSSVRKTPSSARQRGSRRYRIPEKDRALGLFGGEGFIMQRLEGDGLAFLHAGGTVHLVDLEAGETLRVDTGCLVALQPSVSYDVQFVGGVINRVVRRRRTLLHPPQRSGSGCNHFRSADWPTASTRRRHKPVVAGRAKVLCSADSETYWTGSRAAGSMIY